MAEFNGSRYDDKLQGTEFADLVRGGGGNDDVLGLGGNDVLYGDGRIPLVIGRAAAAPFPGVDPYGNDTVYGGDGADTVYGGDGNDVLAGGRGNDSIYGGPGLDSIRFEDATALIVVNLTSGVANGASSNSDVITDVEDVFGTRYDDVIVGNTVANYLQGNDGNDILQGVGGDDTLAGLTGNDRSYGGDGADTLTDLVGNNQFDGGAGIDRAFYFYSTGDVSVDLAAGTGTANGGTNSFVRIEDVYGSNTAHDDLRGDGLANTFYLGGGDDFADGRGGNDRISGNDGDDTVYGADGTDSLFGNAGEDGLYGQAGNDTVYGGDGDDLIFDSLGTNTLYGGNGDDGLTGTGILNGDAGTDVLHSAGVAVLRGGTGQDQLWCGTGGQRVDYDTLADAPSRYSSSIGNPIDREAIHGFRGAEGDRIDVSSIDANALVSGNQAFRFVGTQPVDQAGEIGFITNSSGQRFIVAQVTNGPDDDLAIRIVDASGAITAAHLIL